MIEKRVVLRNTTLNYIAPIAQNQSFVQKGIGVKYMDCLYWCPSIYYYIQLFLHFISYYLITYIISLINCLKSNSNVLILIVITFYLYLNFFYIILLFFYQNLQNLYITVFSLFYRQQTICLKNKNGLKSILVRCFFGTFL